MSIVTDEQRQLEAKAIRRNAVTLEGALMGVASLARAASPRFAPLLPSAPSKVIPGHLPR